MTESQKNTLVHKVDNDNAIHYYTINLFHILMDEKIVKFTYKYKFDGYDTALNIMIDTLGKVLQSAKIDYLQEIKNDIVIFKLK